MTTLKPKIIAKVKRNVNLIWTNTDTCYYSIAPLRSASVPQLAIFDLDGTIQDGQHVIQLMIDAVLSWYHKGFDIVIMSNQHGIAKGHTTHQEMQQRCQFLKTELKIDVSFLYCTEKDKYRKPMTGMYDMFKTYHGYKHHHPDSFYCGDAAGHTTDFAVSDHYFALNCDLKFYRANRGHMTPFHDISPKYSLYDVGSGKGLKLSDWIVPDPDMEIPMDTPVVIMMIGPPGAGKSTLSAKLLSKYPELNIVNRDTIGNTKKMSGIIEHHIANRRSIILDNLNNIEHNRMTLLSTLPPTYSVIIYYFDIPKDLSIHLCHMRVQQSGRYIPPVVRHTYYKYLDIPTGPEVRTIKGLYGDIPKEYYYYYNLKDR
jgi:DNA 3'-phosphatase